jgi:AAHS family 4-hydroxybenzoate transporter-like MFS transporter
MKPRSLDDVVDEIGAGPAQYLLVMFCGEILSGLVKTLMGLGVHEYVETLGFSGFERAAVFSAIFVGNAVGNLSSGYLGDRFGRRVAMLIGNALVAVGLLLVFAGGARSPVFFALFNVIVGLGIGLMGPSCWTLIGESSAAPDRTYFSGWGHVVWSFGAAMVGLSMLAKQDTLSLIGCASLLAWAHLFCVFRYVAESPSFHARRGDRAKSVATLEALCARNGRTAVDCGNWTLVEKSEVVSYSALLSGTQKLRNATFACCFICATVNYSHYGLLYIVPMLINNAAHGALLGVGMSLVASAFATCYAHKFSRRVLMIGSLGASTFLLIPLFHEERGLLYLAVLAAQFAAIGVAFFGVYLYVVEVTAPECRASAAGLAMMCGRLAAASAPFAREWVRNEGFLISMAVMQGIAVAVVLSLSIEPNLRQPGEISGETGHLVEKQK